MTTDHTFSKSERDALYRAIYTRRDVRGQFLTDGIDDDVLARILLAAHHAPSVGFMQPWSFTVITQPDTKQRVYNLFQKANAEAAEMFGEDKREAYKNLRLEGIKDAPINILVTCDKDRAGPVVLGRTHIPEMDLYSTVCAVQNLWLAARVEGLGMGWVSILDQDNLKAELNVPDHVEPVAYLCLGYVSHFKDQPELLQKGWRKRLDLADIIHFNAFGETSDDPYATSLLNTVRQQQRALGDA